MRDKDEDETNRGEQKARGLPPPLAEVILYLIKLCFLLSPREMWKTADGGWEWKPRKMVILKKGGEERLED